MTEEQRIRVALEIIGQEKFESLEQALAAVKGRLDQAGTASTAAEKDIYEFATAADHGAGQVYELASDVAAAQAKIITMGSGLQAVQVNVDELAAAEDRAAAKAKKLADSHAEAGRQSGRMQQQFTQVSYAIQDFTSTSGDLGQKLNSVSNNLMMMTNQMAPWGVAIGVASVASLGLYRNWDAVTGLFLEKNPIPPATETLKRLDEALKATNKELDDYKEKQSLTNAELVKYNALTTESVRLEKEKTAEQEKQQRAARALAAPGQEQKDRASAFGEATAGKGAETLGSLEGAYKDVLGRDVKTAEAQSGKDVEALRDKVNRGEATFEEFQAFVNSEADKIAAMKDSIADEAKRLSGELFDGLIQGTEEAERKFKALVERGTGLGGLAGRINAASPSTKRANEVQDQMDAADAEAAANAFKANQQRVEMLNAQGAENERQMREEDANAEGSAAEKAERAEQRRLVQESRARRHAEHQAAGEMTKESGGMLQGADAANAAQISADLVKQGLDTTSANQAAISQALLTMQGMVGEARRQNQEARRLARESAAMARQWQNGNNQWSELNSGGPY